MTAALVPEFAALPTSGRRWAWCGLSRRCKVDICHFSPDSANQCTAKSEDTEALSVPSPHCPTQALETLAQRENEVPSNLLRSDHGQLFPNPGYGRVAEGRPPVLSVRVKWIFVFPIRLKLANLSLDLEVGRTNRREAALRIHDDRDGILTTVNRPQQFIGNVAAGACSSLCNLSPSLCLTFHPQERLAVPASQCEIRRYSVGTGAITF